MNNKLILNRMILFFLICWKNIRNTKKKKRKKNDRFIRSPKIEQLISYTRGEEHSGYYSPRGGSNCVVFQLLRHGPLPSPINETERARARVHLISLDCKGWDTEPLRRVHFRDKMRITSVPFPRSFFSSVNLGPSREHNRKFSARCHPDYSSVRGVTFIGGLPQPYV